MEIKAWKASALRGGAIGLPLLPEQTSIALEMRCYIERILLMAQALSCDGITYCSATYAENLFAITGLRRGR